MANVDLKAMKASRELYPVEKEIALLFQEILGLETCPTDPFQTFFYYGGNSINLFRFLKSFNAQYPTITLDAKTFYKHPSIHLLAKYVNPKLKTSESDGDWTVRPQIDSLHLSSRRKVKIACFHGSHSSSMVFKYQLKEVIEAMKGVAEFHFIQAPIEVSTSGNFLMLSL